MSETATIRGYTVVFDQGPTNWGAYVEDIPGVCFTVADTREECERQIAEAIDAHLEALREQEAQLHAEHHGHAETVTTPD